MSENTPADHGSGGTGRRSGLDRLRAARGDGEPGAATSASGAAEGTDSAEDGVTRNAGSTALLDTPSRTQDLDETEAVETDAVDADVDADADDSGAVDSEPGDGSRGRRRRLRRRGTAVADADVDTDEPAAAGRRRSRSAGVPTRVGARTSGQPASRRQVLLAVGLALLVIALAIPVVWMRDRIVGETKEERAVKALVQKRDAGLTAGRQFAVTFFTFDYRKVDDFTREVQAMTVGDFNRDFTGRQAELKSTLQQVQSVANARVLAAGVSKVAGDTVEVLVVADQDVQNKASQGKTVTNRYRLAISVQQTPRGWLVNGVTPVV